MDKQYLWQLVDNELAFIASLQLPNGALPMTPIGKAVITDKVALAPSEGYVKICPYFSELAALALLERPARYGAAVRRYLEWHFSHLNDNDYNGLDGTIYDYEVTYRQDGTLWERPLLQDGHPTYDSTDSYAALALELAQGYAEKTGDTAFVIAHLDDLRRIYRAMLATMEDGLTWAKPDYRVKYTMDNCEVVRGLRAVQRLVQQLLCVGVADADRQALQEWATQAQTCQQIVETALNTELYEEPYYLVGRMDGRVPLPEALDPDVFYPDNMAQLFPVLMDILPPDSARAKRLYAVFSDRFGGDSVGWQYLNDPRLGEYRIQGLVAHTAAIVGDTARLEAYFKAYEAQFIRAGHPHPAYNADCAHVACAAAYLAKKL